MGAVEVAIYLYCLRTDNCPRSLTGQEIGAGKTALFCTILLMPVTILKLLNGPVEVGERVHIVSVGETPFDHLQEFLFFLVGEIAGGHRISQ